MHFEILVEERSCEIVLRNILKKFIGETHTFKIYPHQGKPDLLNKLPIKLRAYRKYIPEDWRIVVLIDQDNDDCNHLKTNLNQIADNAGFITKTSANRANLPSFQVLNRIAIEELEAWYFGDIEALESAFPRLPKNLNQRSKYRIPDSIQDTCETLERLLKRAEYYRSGLQKMDCAKKVSENMIPTRNRSKSFQVFMSGIQFLIDDKK